MKFSNITKRIISIITVVFLLFSLTSCKKVLGKRRTTLDLTQKSVVLKSNVQNNSDYADFLSVFSSYHTIPGLYEGVIPVSVCYDSLLDLFIIGGYYEKGKFPSVLLTVSGETGEFKSFFTLENTDGSNFYGLPSGLTSSDSVIFITGSGTAHTISSETLKSAKSGSSVQFESTFNIMTNGDFAAVGNNTLYIGEKIDSADSTRNDELSLTTLETGETFYAYCECYSLVDGLPKSENIKSDSTGYIPDSFIAIPDNVTGISVIQSGDFVVSSCSDAKTDSNISVYENFFSEQKISVFTIDEKEIPIFASSDELMKTTYTAPPLAQSITNFEDYVIILFSSGAAGIRNGECKFPIDTLYKGEIN